jgi:hypothetical protein
LIGWLSGLNADEPGFSELFISHLLARTSIRIEEDLVDQLFNSSEKRLARLLLLLANFGKEARPEPEHADDARFLQPHDHAFRHRRDRRYAPWLAGQAPLAAELVRSSQARRKVPRESS